MAETAVWALCASTSHVISTATSTLDDDLMLTVDDADDLQVCADASVGTHMQLRITRMLDGGTQ